MIRIEHHEKFRIGDLVRFSDDYYLGLVVELQPAHGFKIKENIIDVRVLWVNGQCFWCLDCTLIVVSEINHLIGTI